MLGALRLALALVVLICHVAKPTVVASMAVYTFFTLSGYVMVSARTKSTLSGFIKARFLRIYPAYWAVALASLAFLVWGRQRADLWGPSGTDVWNIRLPHSIVEFFQVFTLTATGKSLIFMPVPPAWSVTVELVLYSLCALGATRTLGKSIALAAFGALVTTINLIACSPWEEFYFSIVSGILPFGLGAVAYHLKDKVPRRHFVGTLAVLGLAACDLALIHVDIDAAIRSPIFYLSIPFAAIAAAAWGPLKQIKWDKELGDLSYPVYLLHTLVAMLLLSATGWSYGGRILLLVLPATLALSVALDRCICRPVNRLRGRDNENNAVPNTNQRQHWAGIQRAIYLER